MRSGLCLSLLVVTLTAVPSPAAEASSSYLPPLSASEAGSRLRSLSPAEGVAPLAPAAAQVEDGGAALSSATKNGALYWTTVESVDGKYARVIGISDGAQRILYESERAYYVFDRSTGTSHRVDTFFDGTPLPDDVWDAAISGDGSTVILLRNPDDSYEPTVRVVRLDQDENFEVTVPDPGHQTWSSGWVEQCSVLTRYGDLHLDEDGNVAWLTSSPCYYDKVLALDISSPSLRWQFISAFRDNTEEVTADGESFVLGADFYYDNNGNGRVDPGEETFTWDFVFPIEFFDNDAEPGNIILNWPSQYPDCYLPSGSRVRADGTASRFVVTTDQVGLDPDTIVYTAGQQLYWASVHDCHLHSLGATSATAAPELRISTDGRSVLAAEDGGATRTEIPTGASTNFSSLQTGAADPFLLDAASMESKTDPGTGEALGSLLRVAQLSGSPSALKVAIVGDSYIAGEGSFGYLAGTNVHDPAEARNLCHRSVSSWAYQVGQRLAAFRINSAHPLLRSFACSGATTRNVEHGQYTEPSQVDQLRAFDQDGGRHVDIVFASMGGNDAGFRSIIETCMAIKCLRSTWKDKQLAAAESAAARGEGTLEKIKAAAPHATVFLTGYPSIVDPPDGGCGDLGLTSTEAALLHYSRFAGALVDAAGNFRVDDHEQAWLNGTLIPALNDDLRRAAAEAGVRWIDPTGWFHGHSVCSNVPYGNGLAAGEDFPAVPKPFLGNESFHPNPDGYAEMATRIEFDFGADFRAEDNPSPISQGLTSAEPANEVGAMVVDGEMQAWGDQGRVTIQGLPDGSKVALGMYSTPTLLATGTVGPDGSVELPYEVPAGIYPGLHALVLYDTETGEPLVTSMTAIEPPEDCLTKPADTDRDSDDLADRCDASFQDGPRADEDGDGIENAEDDCPVDADPQQLDTDENGFGDACDPADGYNPSTELEPFPQVSLPRPKPTVELRGSPQGYSNSRSADIAFMVTHPDASAIEPTVSCSLDGNQLEDCASPLHLTGLDEGFHYLSLEAGDSNGSASTSTSWWVDATPPEITVQSPTQGQHFSYGANVTPVVHCSDNVALSSCSWAGIDTFTPGSHQLTATARDLAGNTAETTVAYFVESPPGEEAFGPGHADPRDASQNGGQAIVSRVSVRRRVILLSLRCPRGTTGCGDLVASVTSRSARTNRRATFGHAVISLVAGESAILRIPLGRAVRKVCARSVRATATLVVDQDGVALSTQRIRLCTGRDAKT